MSKLAGLTGVQGGVIAGAAAVAIAGGAAWYSGAFAPEPQGNTQEVALLPKDRDGAATAEPVTALEPKSDIIVSAPGPKPVEPAARAAEEPEPQPAAAVAMAPEFDLVRVERDGNATIAGRADPSAEVVIEIDGEEAARVQAGGDGSFVQFLEIAASSEPRMVRLRVETEGGAAVFSANGAVIAPMLEEVAATVPVATPPEAQNEPEAPVEQEEQVAAVVDPVAGARASGAAPVVTDREPVEPAQRQNVVAQAEDETAQTTEPMATAPVSTGEPEHVVAAPKPSTETVQVIAIEPEAPAQPGVSVAPAVIIAGQDGVKVLQPLERAPEVMSAVALDTISYTDAGEVQLAGRGQGSGFVRVYVDNLPVTTSRIEADGNWRSDLPDVDSGVYTLRVDEIDSEGQVVSRVETPFKREAQKVVAKAGQVRAITVQPGNTLWAIAQDRYGEGNLYVRLFEANKDRIRNPDLIYPGQVFDIPGE